MTRRQISARALYAYAIIAAIVLAAYWFWEGFGGGLKVDAALLHMTDATKEAERRADDVLDAAMRKEAAVHEAAKKLVEQAEDDELPDLLAALLDEYRKGRH